MNAATKDHLLGVFLAVLDRRSPREHVMALDGLDCLEGHDIFAECDALMRAQWRLMGAPDRDDTRSGVETGNELPADA